MHFDDMNSDHFRVHLCFDLYRRFEIKCFPFFCESGKSYFFGDSKWRFPVKFFEKPNYQKTDQGQPWLSFRFISNSWQLILVKSLKMNRPLFDFLVLITNNVWGKKFINWTPSNYKSVVIFSAFDLYILPNWI